MYRIVSALTAGLLMLTGAEALAAPQTLVVADAEAGSTLTLSDAKHLVAQVLSDNGERTLRVGRAEFDGSGNVTVEIATLQGITVRHVIVDAKSRLVADARTHAPLSKKG